MSNGKTNLTERINLVMLEVKALKPDKHHAQQKYGYISADKILGKLGQAMAQHGLSVEPGIISNTIALDEPPNKKPFFTSNVQMEMVISDASGNESKRPWYGCGIDYGSPDKAFYKAVTSGHKYFIMKLFMVGVGNEDGEHEQPTPPDNTSVRKNNAPRQTQADKDFESLPSQGKKKMAVSDDQRKPTDKMMKALHAAGNGFYGEEWDAQRAVLVKAVTKDRVNSSKFLTYAECKTLIDGINKKANG